MPTLATDPATGGVAAAWYIGSESSESREPGRDKKARTAALLDRVAGEGTILRAGLEDSRELTDIGNQLQIRHTATDREPITEPAVIDYLFARAFALI